MAVKSSVHRQTIALPVRTAQRVRALARARNTSARRVLAGLVEAGLRQEERQRQEFMSLAESFRQASDPKEIQRLGDELGRAVFGR